MNKGRELPVTISQTHQVLQQGAFHVLHHQLLPFKPQIFYQFTRTPVQFMDKALKLCSFLRREIPKRIKIKGLCNPITASLTPICCDSNFLFLFYMSFSNYNSFIFYRHVFSANIWSIRKQHFRCSSSKVPYFTKLL